MADPAPSKYVAHVFVCTHFRESGSSCANKNSAVLRDELKALCKNPALAFGKKVRINTAGCLDRCEEGIAAVIYPQGEWLTELSSKDAPKLLEKIQKLIP